MWLFFSDALTLRARVASQRAGPYRPRVPPRGPSGGGDLRPHRASGAVLGVSRGRVVSPSCPRVAVESRAVCAAGIWSDAALRARPSRDRVASGGPPGVACMQRGGGSSAPVTSAFSTCQAIQQGRHRAHWTFRPERLGFDASAKGKACNSKTNRTSWLRSTLPPSRRSLWASQQHPTPPSRRLPSLHHAANILSLHLTGTLQEARTDRVDSSCA